MRILMTTDTVGGVWTFTEELAAGLLRAGCEVALVSFGRIPSDSQRSWREDASRAWGQSFRYKASYVPLEWMQENAGAYSDAAPLLMKIGREFEPDLIHSNQFCFGALPLNIPKIVTAHSDVLSWAESCRDAKLEDSEWLRQYCFLVQSGLTGADAVVAPTRWMLDALGGNFMLPETATIIPNGRTLDVREAVPRKLQAITAGRLWDEAKHIALLRDVQSPIPLLLAGETQDPETFPPDRVTLLGELPPESLLAIFRESSIYICTSRYEPFGLAPLEAALCGCAVVANDIPSLREVWRDGAVYFSGAASLTALLQNLCSSAERLRTARLRSFQRARLFTAERMTEGYIQIFKAALARSEVAAYAS